MKREVRHRPNTAGVNALPCSVEAAVLQYSVAYTVLPVSRCPSLELLVMHLPQCMSAAHIA